MTRSGKIILSVVLLFLIQSFEISAQEKLNLLSGTYTYEVLEKIVIPDSQWHPFPTGSEGLYLAAKGGHNAESHNHNDVGNFIVYADGYPAISDVGVETYTAKTFSAQRYDIWTMQSAFHNLPIINGFMQKNGGNFKAAAVNYEAD